MRRRKRHDDDGYPYRARTRTERLSTFAIVAVYVAAIPVMLFQSEELAAVWLLVWYGLLRVFERYGI